MGDFSEEFQIEDSNVESASNFLHLLITAWVNEKNSPELLKYAADVVDCMMDQIETMDENLQNLSRDDFRVVPHQMEVNRIRYILSSYHRYRLEKIETFAAYLVKKDKAASFENRVMSPRELLFAEEFLAHERDHFHNEVIKYMPTGVLSDTERTVEVRPNLQSSVFIDVLRDGPRIVVNKDEEVNLSLGSRHILPYCEVSTLIQDGSVVLL